MSRNSKTAAGLVLALGMAIVQQTQAFSFWGPAETWQTPTLDYVTRFWYSEVELGGTKNFGEASRLNVPVLTYAYDDTFLEFFGQQGVNAVDAAMAVLNALPAASSARPDLTEFIMQGNQQINYTAQALGMLDLKSTVLSFMLEHMGLIGETHVFDLRERVAAPGGGCVYGYLTIPRNFDPITWDPTPYVNGQLWSYYIAEGCLGGIQVADAYEQPADTTRPAFEYTAVATKEGLNFGGYYLGITRDDFGGLRYLYSQHRFSQETLDPEAQAFFNGGGGGGSPFAPYIAPTNAVAGTTATGAPAPPTTNGPFFGVLGGVEKILFIKVAYSPQVSTNFNPLQYNYSIPYITSNNISTTLLVTRTITAPDILFTAADLVVAGYPASSIDSVARGAFNETSLFIPGPVSAGGGVTQGVLAPGYLVTLDEIGPTIYNYNPGFLGGNGGFPGWIWGSFDGSTNAPIPFPNGQSLVELEQQVLLGGTGVSGGGSDPFGTPPVPSATNAVATPPATLTY